jgi:hypothetical protein
MSHSNLQYIHNIWNLQLHQKWHLLLQHFSCGNTTQGYPWLFHRFLFNVVSFHPPVPRFNIPHSLLPNHNVLRILIPLVIHEMEKVNFLLSMYHLFWTCVPTTSPFQVLLPELYHSSYNWYNTKMFLIYHTQFSFVVPQIDSSCPVKYIWINSGYFPTFTAICENT